MRFWPLLVCDDPECIEDIPWFGPVGNVQLGADLPLTKVEETRAKRERDARLARRIPVGFPIPDVKKEET